MTGEVNLAVVGLGYWGPNLLRVSSDLDRANLVGICDRNPRLLAGWARRFPTAKPTESVDTLLEDPELDAVLLATPIPTHFDLALRCLRAGKHVMVEKPMADTVEQAQTLIREADERGLVLMPGHTFLYSPPITAVKEILDRGELGDLYFATSSRVNLGIHQSGASVVRDLAPHDYSILLHWFGRPSFLRAIGRASVVPETVDVAFIDIGYTNGCLVHVELAWLAPTKMRRTVLVGTEKMVVYDDTSLEQVRIFDRGVERMDPGNFGEFQLSYRSGDIVSPRLDAHEPLRLELEDLVEAIREDREPKAGKELGLDVVRMVEATETSLAFNGAPVSFDASPEERRRLPDRRRSLDGMPVIPRHG